MRKIYTGRTIVFHRISGANVDEHLCTDDLLSFCATNPSVLHPVRTRSTGASSCLDLSLDTAIGVDRSGSGATLVQLGRAIWFACAPVRFDVMVFIDPDNPLAAEILQESGEAYFAACRKMVDSLEELSSFDRELASLVLDDEQIARRSELLDNAAERVHFVLIQREAMKLSPSETFFEDYEVPAEVQARLGQRER